MLLMFKKERTIDVARETHDARCAIGSLKSALDAEISSLNLKTRFIASPQAHFGLHSSPTVRQLGLQDVNTRANSLRGLV